MSKQTDQRRRRLMQGAAGLTASSLLPPLALASAPADSQTNTQQTLSEKPKQRDSNMSINTVRYEYQGQVQWGVLREGGITPIPGDYPTTGDFIAGVSPAGLRELKGETIAAEQVKILSPVTRNQRFVC
ncbi:MAG: DUF2437 domain-containing protein, partial [Nevskiales bacterium]